MAPPRDRRMATDTRLPAIASATCHACGERPVRAAPERLDDHARGRRPTARRPATGRPAARCRCRRLGPRTPARPETVSVARIGRMIAASGGTGRPHQIERLRGRSRRARAAGGRRARQLARRRDELTSRFGEPLAACGRRATPTDLVSDADLAAEAAIREVLGAPTARATRSWGRRAARPGRASCAGSSTRSTGRSTSCSGSPSFAVSVACEDATGSIAGVVLDPIREECFAATRSGDADAERRSDPGVGSRRARDRDGRHRVRLRRGGARAPGGGRRAGCCRACATSAASAPPRSICAWCACGRFDAYYERGVHAWDIGAGALIALARRAGASRDLAAAGEDPAGCVVGAARRSSTSCSSWCSRGTKLRARAAVAESARRRRISRARCPSGRVGSTPTRRTA